MRRLRYVIRPLHNYQSGAAHFGLLLLFVVTIGAAGFVGYNVYQKNTSQAETSSTEATISCFALDDSGLPVDCTDE